MRQKLFALIVTVAMLAGVLSACRLPSTAYYGVTFDLGGTTQVVDAPDSQTVARGNFAIEPALTPKADGKIFVKWAKTAAGTETFVFASEAIRADTVVYAVWRDPFVYELTFDANGGENPKGMPAKQTLTEPAKPKFPAGTPTADAQSFAGWYQDPACTQKFDFNAPMSANATAYAKWSDASDLASFAEYRNFRGNGGLTDAKAPESADDLEVKWQKKYSSSWMASMGWPIEVGDYVYFTQKVSGSSIMKASKVTGEVVLSHALCASTGFFSSISYGDGKIFVPLEGGILQAFDAETLTPVWQTEKPQDKDGNVIASMQSLSTVLYHDGYVYMGVSHADAVSGAFFCVDTRDEDPASENEEKGFVWSFNAKDRDPNAAGGFYWSVGTVVGDYIVFAGEEGVLYAHSLTGADKDAFGVTVFSDSYTLTNADGASGAEAVRSGVAYDAASGRLYLNSKAGSVHSIRFDASTGKFDDESYLNAFIAPDITSTPTVYRGRLYVGGGGISSQAPFTVMDAETLDVIYQYQIQSQSSPIITTAYATAENNYKVYIYILGHRNPDGLYLIEDWQGKTAADADATPPEFFPSPVAQYNTSSVMIDKDGMIYYKNDSGNLFAIGSKTDHAYTAADVENAISNLPSLAGLTLADRDEVMRANYRYAQLDPAENAKVKNYAKLEALLDRLETLAK